MSWSISMSGHGAAPDDIKEVFENSIRGARAVSDGEVGGSLWATDESGQNGISVQASDVSDDDGDPGDPADDPTEDAGPDDSEDDPGEDDPAIADKPPTTEG